MEEVRAYELITALLKRVENHHYTLHRHKSYYDQCTRLKKGIALTKPADCDCGLDELLIATRAYLAQPQEDVIPENFEQQSRWNPKKPW